MGIKVNWGGKDRTEKVNRIEPGEYEGRLAKFEYGKSKNGNAQWVAHWEVTNLPDGVAMWPIKEYYLEEGVSWKWQQLLEAAGVKAEEDDELDLDVDDIKELVGTEALLVLVDDTFNDQPRSKIKRVKPL